MRGPGRRTILIAWTVAYLALAIVAAIGSQEPPAERPSDAPPREFSAARAFRHVSAIAKGPHPAGSPEAAEVRAALLREIQAMGLEWTSQSTNLDGPDGRDTLEFVNVTARLKGAGPPGLKAVLLMAHDDSVPGAPGASDDASGVATLLETLRALRAGPPLKRDVIALFTDGEEVGMVGAKLFVGEPKGGMGAGHPWMNDVGLIINVEASGNRGPCTLFETSGRNGWLIREFARANPQPIANSFGPSVYHLLDAWTDLTAFRQADLPALNLAFVRGKWYYHTAQDTPSNLDRRSLQHQGAQTLALARHFGNIDRDDPREPDAVYFNPVGSWLVVYPGSWAKPLAVVATLLYASVVLLGYRAGRVTTRGLIAGFVAFPVALTLGALASRGAWWLLTLIRPLGEWQASDGPVGAALVGLALAVFVAIYAPLWKRAGTDNLDLGSLGWWAILTVAWAWTLPGASFVAPWPLLARLSTTALAWRLARPIPALLLSDLGTLPAISIVAAGTASLFAGLGLGLPEVVSGAAMFLPGATLPQLARLFAPGPAEIGTRIATGGSGQPAEGRSPLV